jgi:predicted nucleotidyltransferase
MSLKLAENFEDVLHALNNNEVDFMIVGGYAVVFYGYGRTTGDLDIWINPEDRNKKRLITAFKELKFPSKLVDHIKNTDFKKPFAVKIGAEPIQIDLFNAITGVEYTDARERSISYKYVDNLVVNFIHLQDLIVNKMLTGRLKDAADVEQLHNINKYSTDKRIVAWLKKFFGRKKT